MDSSSAKSINENNVSFVFRVLTGGLCLLGIFGVGVILVALFRMLISSYFNLSILLAGCVGIFAFILWVLAFGYITLNGKLPSKYNFAKGKNT
ncbi:MAG: hypothetical protein ACSHW0_19395 [Thalassotalea sp.]